MDYLLYENKAAGDRFVYEPISLTLTIDHQLHVEWVEGYIKKGMISDCRYDTLILPHDYFKQHTLLDFYDVLSKKWILPFTLAELLSLKELLVCFNRYASAKTYEKMIAYYQSLIEHGDHQPLIERLLDLYTMRIDDYAKDLEIFLISRLKRDPDDFEEEKDLSGIMRTLESYMRYGDLSYSGKVMMMSLVMLLM